MNNTLDFLLEPHKFPVGSKAIFEESIVHGPPHGGHLVTIIEAQEEMGSAWYIIQKDDTLYANGWRRKTWERFLTKVEDDDG